jgi:hypothetical protein
LWFKCTIRIHIDWSRIQRLMLVFVCAWRWPRERVETCSIQLTQIKTIIDTVVSILFYCVSKHCVDWPPIYHWWIVNWKRYKNKWFSPRLEYYSGISLEILNKIIKIIYQDSRYLGWDSNWTPSEYKILALFKLARSRIAAGSHILLSTSSVSEFVRSLFIAING